MVFLELNEKEIFYKEGLTFYIPSKELGILVLPFISEEVVYEKLDKIKDIKKLEIITISNEFEVKNKNFEVEVLPFTRWRFAE